MAIQAAQLVAKIEVQGDAEAKAKLENVGSTVQETSGGFKSMLSNALSFASGQAIFTLVGDAVGFLRDQISDTIKVTLDHQQVAAQTVQVLKSTRDVSGETAGSLSDLADAFSKTTEFSADTVQGGENLLLTFTNIGKSVFPQATQAILDVSQAMHQDLQTSAIQVGKALGDPTTGMTALMRIGVTFSQSEKDQIKTMMAHNDVIGAQKIILKELSTEFGGSATAAGKTFAGQMDILKNHFDDLKIKIGTALLPILNQFLGWFLKNGVPVLERFADWFVKDGVPALQKFGGWIQQNVIPVLQKMGEWIGKNVIPVLQQMGTFVQQNVIPALIKFGGWFQKDAMPVLQQFVGILQKNVFPVIGDLVSIIGTALGWIRDHWTQIWGLLGPLLKGVWDIISGIVSAAWAVVSGIIHVGLDLIQGKWGKVWTDIKDASAGFFDGIIRIVHGFTGIIGDAFSGLGTLVHGVWDGIVGAIKGAINLVIGLINDFIGGIDSIGIDIGPVHVHPSIPKIPYLATGGDILSTGLAMVHKGERVIPAGANLVPASVSHGGGGGGYQGPAVINIHIAGRKVASTLMPDIVSAIRQGVGTHGF